MPTRVKVTIPINNLQSIVPNLSVSLDKMIGFHAGNIQKEWAGDVRVSPGPGEYDGSNGGSPGHYRDNIFVQRSEKNAWLIVALPKHAIFNEFGSHTIGARPSALIAAQHGFKLIEDGLRSAITSVTLGKGGVDLMEDTASVNF